MCITLLSPLKKKIVGSATRFTPGKSISLAVLSISAMVAFLLPLNISPRSFQIVARALQYPHLIIKRKGSIIKEEKGDKKLDIRLYTNASDFEIGGVLFQIVDIVWQPIAFISKSLTPAQIRWSTIQKKAYAIFYCCTQLDCLIRDRTFTIYTDHLNITYMKQNPTSMVARWFVALQELHFTVVFVPGTSNALVDALSRICPNLIEIALPL